MSEDRSDTSRLIGGMITDIKETNRDVVIVVLDADGHEYELRMTKRD